MSSITKTVDQDNQIFADYETKKIFLWNNRFSDELFDEPTGSDFTLEAGMVVGKNTSNDKIERLDATATNGSHIPVGIVAKDVSMSANATDVQVPICRAGHVDEGSVKLTGSQTLDGTVIGSGGTTSAEYKRTIRDAIHGETLGIELVTADELTKFDNS